jgi:4-hydroxybenzoate polyprenyltransferase
VARGIIPIRIAGPLAVGLIGLGLLGAFLLETSFALVLGGYVALTVAYSCGLKRIPLLDTLVIAVLFVSRVGMGIALTGHALSDWLLSFSATLFFSLALAKRHTEILRATEAGRDDALIARGYRAADADLTLVLGAGAGLLSILILILYIVEDAFASVGYGSPGWLRLIPLFFSVWVGRIWLIAHRGEMSDDPVSFALRDRASLLLGAGVVTAFLLAV